MRINPVESKHFELLQLVEFPRDDVEEEALYAQLVSEQGMCPWLAGALFLLTVARKHRKRAVLAYLQADHSPAAQLARAQYLEVPPEVLLRRVSFGDGLSRAQQRLVLGNGSGKQRRAFVVALYHWKKL